MVTLSGYLPDIPTTMVSFFDAAIESTLENLRKVPVLESCAGTMEKASHLKYVPSILGCSSFPER